MRQRIKQRSESVSPFDLDRDHAQPSLLAPACAHLGRACGPLRVDPNYVRRDCADIATQAGSGRIQYRTFIRGLQRRNRYSLRHRRVSSSFLLSALRFLTISTQRTLILLSHFLHWTLHSLPPDHPPRHLESPSTTPYYRDRRNGNAGRRTVYLLSNRRSGGTRRPRGHSRTHHRPLRPHRSCVSHIHLSRMDTDSALQTQLTKFSKCSPSALLSTRPPTRTNRAECLASIPTRWSTPTRMEISLDQERFSR